MITAGHTALLLFRKRALPRRISPPVWSPPFNEVCKCATPLAVEPLPSTKCVVMSHIGLFLAFEASSAHHTLTVPSPRAARGKPRPHDRLEDACAHFLACDQAIGGFVGL